MKDEESAFSEEGTQSVTNIEYDIIEKEEDKARPQGLLKYTRKIAIIYPKKSLVMKESVIA